MGRETRVRMPRNQSKAGMGIAYRQRNESMDVEKSVQSWYKNSLWADKRECGCREISPKQAWNSIWADKRERGCL